MVQKALSVRTHVCPHCGYIRLPGYERRKEYQKARTEPSGSGGMSGHDELRSPR